MISLRIVLGLFHLTCVIRTGSSCGGNSALKVIEMCKGGSTMDRHFYLHGAPADDLRLCDCNLTITGAAGTVSFTPVSVFNNATTCGGTLTLADGAMRDCEWNSTSPQFLYPGTRVVSFAYAVPDVKFCVEVEVTATATNISMECPLSLTTATQPSPLTPQTTNNNVTSSSISTTIPSSATTSPLPTDTSTSSSTSTTSSNETLTTSTTVSVSTTKSPTVSSSENRSTTSVTNPTSSTDEDKPESTTVGQTSFPVAAVAGGVGAGFLLLLVLVIVVILCYRRGRHVDKQEDDKQEESKGPSEVITVTNSLYESSADITNTLPTKPLTTVEHQVNNTTVEGQLPQGLTSDIASCITDQHNGKPGVTDQNGGTSGNTALQDATLDEHRNGQSDMYAVVNKPKKSLEATNVNKQSHTDPENVSKEKSPPPIDDSAVYAKVNKPSPKTYKF